MTPDEHPTEFYLPIVANQNASADERDAAARHLHSRLRPTIQGIMLRGGLSEENVDGLLSDLCVKIVSFTLGYNPEGGGRLRDYVARWAYNKVADYFRPGRHKAAASGGSEVQSLLNEIPDKAENFSSVLSGVIDGEMREMLRVAERRARAELTDEDRAVIHLIHDKMLKPDKAAEQMKILPNRVYQLTHKYRKRVKVIFFDLGGAASWVGEVAP